MSEYRYREGLLIVQTGRDENFSPDEAPCEICKLSFGGNQHHRPAGTIVVGNARIVLCAECSVCLAECIGFIVGHSYSSDRRQSDDDHHVNQMISFYWRGVSEALRQQVSTLVSVYHKTNKSAQEIKESHNNLIQHLDSEAERKDGEGYVYLMHRDDGCHKIGLSGKPDRRLTQIQRDFPSAALVHTMRVDDMRQAESRLHQEYAHHRKDGEWFDLSADQVETICKHIRFEDGWFLTRREEVR